MTTEIVRTTEGLRDFMFKQIEQFNQGKVTPGQVKTACAAVNTILETAKVDLDYAKFATVMGKNKKREVSPLALGNGKTTTARTKRLARA